MQHDTYIFLVVVVAVSAVLLFIWWWRDTELRSWRRDVCNGYWVEFYDKDKDTMLHGEVIGTAVDYVVVKTDYGTYQCRREDLYPWS